jgi:D-sedoheptulose 7-phosphate isomerase
MNSPRSRVSIGVANGNLELVKQQVRNSLSVKQKLLEDTDLLSLAVEIAEIASEALQNGKKLLLFGNGGSAADAAHIAAELVGRYQRERRGLPALALSSNLSSVTAIANDYGFDSIFSRQVEAFGTAGDIAIGISTSGDSENILRALKTARERRMTTVGMTGRRGGRLKTSVDYCLAVPSDETPRVQECHILLGHIICDLVERALFHE